ncbi:MAG: TRAP transporter large permease subunit [Deinococcales bacterium]
MATVLKRITFGVLLVATLYHLYLVLHPYMPWSRSEIPLFDLTQVERAAHVFLLVLAGYLLMAARKPTRVGVGSWIFVALAVVPLYAFWRLGMPLVVELATTLFWAVAVLPAVLPRVARAFDLVAAMMSVAPFLYLLLQFNDLVSRAMLPVPWDLVMSFGLTFLVLGLVYRMLGPVLPSLVLIFLLYNLYGYLVPGTLQSPGFPLDMLLGKLYAETEAGLFGIITGVSLKYLVYFTILGAVISALGFGEIIANIAFLLVGKSPAAPGRATSVMAVMMGWFSGSGAADTLFVSTLNEPLFKRAGYNRLIVRVSAPRSAPSPTSHRRSWARSRS